MGGDREKGLEADGYNEGSALERETLLSIKLRRGLAMGKKFGPCTPSPAWKLEEVAGEELESDAIIGEMNRSAARQRKSVSARKLGANLWDAHGLMPVIGSIGRSGRSRRRRDVEMNLDDDFALCSEDRPQSAGSLTRRIATSLIQHCRPNERKHQYSIPESPVGYGSSLEATSFKPEIRCGRPPDVKDRIEDDAGYRIKTSTELLKVLNRIWCLEEEHASNVSAIHVLKMELGHARERIQELMQEQKERRREMNGLTNLFTEDKVVNTNKELGRMKAAVKSMRDELDDERRLRRRSEDLHRKLGRELSETKSTLSNALEDLENERKSNCLLEDICEEFAKGVVSIRESKKSAKHCQHNGEIDDLLLYISKVWLDERSQMQMVESHSRKTYNLASRLGDRLAPFLGAHRGNSFKDDGEQQQQLNMWRQSLESLHLNGAISAPHDHEDSSSSDLQCFELNMHKNKDGAHLQLPSHIEINPGRRTSPCHRSIKSKKSLSFQQERLDSQGSDLIADSDQSKATIDHKFVNSNFPTGCETSADAAAHHMEKNHLVYHASYTGETSKEGRGHLPQNSGENMEETFMAAPELGNGRGLPVDFEMSKRSSNLQRGLKENTLKAKLLEARLEGRQARLNALKGA